MALIANFVTGKPVSFRRVRHLLAQMGLQEGVINAGDLKTAQRAAGANMSADVAVGEAWVAVDTGVRNGIAHLTNDAVANVVVPASDATNPTVHSVVAQYNDTAIPAGAGGDDPTLRLIAGTPTAGATLDNRSGAPAMPADAILLADVLVPAASTSVINANIRDRRRWARGARHIIRRISNAGGTNHYTMGTGTKALIDATNLNPRIECSGAPLRLKLYGLLQHSATGENVMFNPSRNGGPAQGSHDELGWTCPGVNYFLPLDLEFEFVPPDGSQRLGWMWYRSGAGTTTLHAAGSNPVILSIEERPGAIATND